MIEPAPAAASAAAPRSLDRSMVALLAALAIGALAVGAPAFAEGAAPNPSAAGLGDPETRTPFSSAWDDPGLQVIDLLEPGTRFYRQSSVGTVTPDASAPLEGAGSLRLAIAGADGQLNLRAELQSPLDLSDKNLLLWLRVEDPQALAYVALYAGNDDLESFNAYLVSLGDDDPSMLLGRSGEWHAVSVNLADPSSTTGAPDLTRVDALQLSLAASGESEAVVNVHGLASFPRAARGAVTVMFDDARDGVALAVPILQRLGLPASVAVITEFLDAPGFLTLAELVALERYLGWELVAHHTADVPLERSFDSYDEPALANELEALTAWLRDASPSRGWRHLVYPNGRIDEEAIATVRRYFISGRTTVGQLGLETWPPGDPYRLRATSVLASDAPEALIDLIDRAAASGGWLILAFHQIVEGETEFQTQYRIDDLQRVMEHLARADVDVLLLSDRWP